MSLDILEQIVEQIHQDFEQRTAAREKALATARSLTRACANAIRATHRNDRTAACEILEQASTLSMELHRLTEKFPDIYFEGYTQDALKEFAEATIVFNLLDGHDLPLPQELNLESSTYIKGMAEAIGELRRRCLDSLRVSDSSDSEKYLGYMDDMFAVLISMDYPDAITGGLRRLTDIARGIIERTRGDLTLILRHENLEKNLSKLESKLNHLNTIDNE